MLRDSSLTWRERSQVALLKSSTQIRTLVVGSYFNQRRVAGLFLDDLEIRSWVGLLLSISKPPLFVGE